MEGDFLSDIIDLDEVGDYGRLNLIIAPCGAGKTTFALQHLAPMYRNPARALYLIDTVAGQDQLLQNPKFRCYDKDWRADFTDTPIKDDGKIVVMTYARFGTLCKYFPNWYIGLDTIICDEIHKLFEMRLWNKAANIPDNENIYAIAWNYIFLAFHLEQVPAVYGLTATPEALYEHFRDKDNFYEEDPRYFKEKLSHFIYTIPLYGTPRHYVQKALEHYNNLIMLCHRLPADKKGIIYVPRIVQMTNCIEVLDKRGIRAVGIWSPNNQEWWMDKQQYAVRQHIIENATVPDDVDILLINKSCETSINIKSHIDYMVVHSNQEDTQTQAIGRYRNDLDLVYLFNPDIWDDIDLPSEMLNTPLYKEDIDSYITEHDIRDEHGHIMKQPSFLKHIAMWDYEVQSKKKKGGKRYHIITRIATGTQN